MYANQSLQKTDVNIWLFVQRLSECEKFYDDQQIRKLYDQDMDQD